MSILLILCAGAYLSFVLFIISGLFRHSEKPIEISDDPPSVTIIIAARNEEKNLPSLIQDLVNQEYPTDKLEILFVDDRSLDSTPEILAEAVNNYSFLKTIRIEDKYLNMAPKKYALQTGINAAKNEIILTTDADCKIPKLWTSSMAYSVLHNGGITIGYSSVAGDSFFHKYQMIDFLGIIAANAGASGWGQHWSGTGQNLAYKKSDFEFIDGFEPVADKLSGDDMYLVQSISRHGGGCINIDPNSFVTTQPVDTLKQFESQRIRWSSNAKDNMNKKVPFFTFLLSAFLCNTAILLSLLFNSNGAVFVFLIKFILEGLVIYFGGMLFGTIVKPSVYLTWAIVQPLYIPFVGLLGLAGKFKWK